MSSGDWLEPGGRIKEGRRRGTIVEGVYSGYVTVKWDTGVTEKLVHIRWLKPID